VVTVHEEEISGIEDLLHRVEDGGHPLERGAGFLAHSILDRLVDQLLPAVESLDEHLDQVEIRVLARPSLDQLRATLLLRRNALRLRHAVLAERDMVNRLARGEFPELIPEEALIFFRDIYDHLVRGETLVEGLRDLADGVLNTYLSSVNNRSNEVMKAMSIVAVIFLPLTLIASVFGTNLDYSLFGASFDGGFYLMLAFMLLIAGALVYYFKKRGWL
jgi:magnesium transporter